MADTDLRYTRAEVDDAVAEALRRVQLMAPWHEKHQAGAGGCILDAVGEVAGALGIRLDSRPESGVTTG